MCPKTHRIISHQIMHLHKCNSTMQGSIVCWIWLMLLVQQLSAVDARSLTILRTDGRDLTSGVPMKECYNDLLDIFSVAPTFSTDMVPLMLSNVRLDTTLNTADHLACHNSSRRRKQQPLQHAWPFPADPRRNLTLKQHSFDLWPIIQASCNSSSIPGLSIAITRKAPLSHFGHRMLSELPALYALKLYLTSAGVNITHVRVIYTDDQGHPAWGSENFKPILQSLGYKSYEPLMASLNTSTICFERVIFMPVMFYPKWYITPQGKMVYMWQAPDKLYDTDPFHISMIGHIRKHALGLPEQLPFAPATNRTVVLASRDAKIRNRLGFRQKRLLLNEDELYERLLKLNNTNVVRVDLGAETIANIGELLDRTSLFLGYHGAAFDNLVFLPRGAFVLEILPMGTDHAPLYPALAHRTGKEFARYVNKDPTRQTSQSHFANLRVDVDAVMELVESIMKTQEATLRRFRFDASVRRVL